MMMTATIFTSVGFLKRGPAEFSGPDDQRFIEHSRALRSVMSAVRP